MSNTSVSKDTESANEPTSRFLFVLLSVVSVLMGFLSTIQNGMNGRMGNALGTGLYPLFYSFATGIGLVFIFRFIEAWFRHDPYRDNTRPDGVIETLKRVLYLRTPINFYFIIPPIIGLLFVLCGTFLTPELGFGLLFVIQILGSLISSVVIDHFALVGMPRNRANWLTFVGLALAVVGAILTVVSQIQDTPPDNSAGITALFCILTFLVGIIFPFQATTNNKLTVESVPTALASSLMMYSIGLAIAFVIVFIYSLAQPDVFYALSSNVKDVPDYAWISGFVGAAFVTLAIFVAPAIGTAFWMALMLAGQLVSACIFDHFDIFSLGKYEASGMRIAGIIVAFVSVVCLKLASFLNKKESSSNEDDVELGKVEGVQQHSSEPDSPVVTTQE